MTRIVAKDIITIVMVCRAGSDPVFGARATVTGVYEDACEVIFDEAFKGGSDLNGRCNGAVGAVLPKEALLNVTKPQALGAPAGNTARCVCAVFASKDLIFRATLV